MISPRFLLILTIVLAVVSCSAVLPSIAQEPYYIRQTINRGLPSNSITSILPSRSGLIWIATSQGLCTFDGSVVREVPRPRNADIRLALFLIQTSVEDSTGALWFGTTKGLVRYTPHEGAWQFFPPDTALPKEASSIITLLCDHQGTVWIATRGGLMRFDAKQTVV